MIFRSNNTDFNFVDGVGFLTFPALSELKFINHAFSTRIGGISKDGYKSMNLKDRIPAMSEEEQYKLLSTDGLLVKRPIVVDGDTVLVGFKEPEWIAHFSD